MDVAQLSKKERAFLERTYPKLSVEQALNAFLNDAMHDQDLLHEAAERAHDRRDLIWSLVGLSVVILWSFWYFT